MTEREQEQGDEGERRDDAALDPNALQAGSTPGSSPAWPDDKHLGDVADPTGGARVEGGKPTPGSEPTGDDATQLGGDEDRAHDRGQGEEADRDAHVQRRPEGHEAEVQRKPEGHEAEVQRKPGT